MAALWTLSNTAWADSTETKNGGGEWLDSVTWTNGVPSGVDTATIHSGDAVTIEKPGCGAGTIYHNGEMGVHAGQPPNFLKGSLGVENFNIGVTALGQVRLDTGATIASSHVTLGYQLGSGYITLDGEANFLGDRAIWTNFGEFHVGGSGVAPVDGVVMLSNRGTIKSRNTDISSGTSTGTVNINNATWTNTNLFSVGHGGTLGILRIENHGVLNDLTGALGYGAGNPDVLTDKLGKGFVDNSTWNNSGDFYVGFYARAELSVFAGGVVTNTNAYVGYGVTGVSPRSLTK